MFPPSAATGNTVPTIEINTHDAEVETMYPNTGLVRLSVVHCSHCVWLVSTVVASCSCATAIALQCPKLNTYINSTMNTPGFEKLEAQTVPFEALFQKAFNTTAIPPVDGT